MRMPSPILQAAQDSEPAPDETVGLQNVLPTNLDIIIDDWQPDQVTGRDLLISLIAVVVAIVLAILIGRVVSFVLGRWSAIPPFGAALAGRLTTYFIILIGVVVALEGIGLTLGPLVIIVAAVVMAVWAMKPLLQNMSAGLLLQARGPFQPGEEIRSADFEG